MIAFGAESELFGAITFLGADWSLQLHMQACWSEHPKDRPRLEEVIITLHALLETAAEAQRVEMTSSDQLCIDIISSCYIKLHRCRLMNQYLLLCHLASACQSLCAFCGEI